ncbi:hypothetical protein KF707_02530 [Candidatus Obscuribacterales bacterium]|nr:hypothetical protein [Candidatus Obscuribacterales bacterium]MBX3135083.1 hypothetical protein [Candidatus Obscuribacterales bacterium]MBX3150900.1 hypothetical protein [Candidatus Obscuribacterales bacterium]
MSSTASPSFDDADDIELSFTTAPSSQPEPPGFIKGIRSWTRPFVLMHKIPVVKRIWVWVAIMAVYTIAVDWFAEETFPAHMFKEFSAVSSSGIILGLLLVFRTNSAYERWWEGRKLWGQLVNDSRNICLKVRSIDGIRNTDKARLGELVISFAYALKHHLRGTKPSRPLPGVGVVSDVDAQNIPVHIAGKIFELMQKWRRDGQVDGMLMLQFDRHALAFMDIAGGCERIKNSPIAISYRAFMRQGIALNLLAMPWYMSQSFSMWWCLPLVLTATYFLVGIELIAEDIEDPFGYDGDDLPLDNICAGIRRTVGQIMKFEDDSEYTRSMDLPRFDFLKGS